MNPKHPQRLTVAEFLADRIAEIDKTQREIAQECGFEHPNVITMFKNGHTKLPINRVAPLAKALGVDSAYLLRLVLSEYMPEAWECIEDIMHSTVLSANELLLVRAYRESTGHIDARPSIIKRDTILAVVTA